MRFRPKFKPNLARSGEKAALRRGRGCERKKQEEAVNQKEEEEEEGNKEEVVEEEENTNPASTSTPKVLTGAVSVDPVAKLESVASSKSPSLMSPKSPSVPHLSPMSPSLMSPPPPPKSPSLMSPPPLSSPTLMSPPPPPKSPPLAPPKSPSLMSPPPVPPLSPSSPSKPPIMLSTLPKQPPASPASSTTSTCSRPVLLSPRRPHHEQVHEAHRGRVRRHTTSESSTSSFHIRGIQSPLSAASHAQSQTSSVLETRRQMHHQKFGSGVPERTTMTMFDLIYYNPADGPKMAANTKEREGSRRNSIAASDDFSLDDPPGNGNESGNNSGERRNEEAVDDPRPSTNEEPQMDDPGVTPNDNDPADNNLNVEENDEESLPAPRVKVGPNGEVILDEESTFIETTASKRAKEELEQTPLLFETTTTNYANSWSRRRRSADWSDRETLKFYKALSVFGTDFSMMESIFKRRKRHELKLKFKREERARRHLVDKCLTDRAKQFDTSLFDLSEDDSEDAEDEDPEKKTFEMAIKRGRRRKKKDNNENKAKKKRKRSSKKKTKVSNRGYYSESSEDADLSEEACMSPRKKTRMRETSPMKTRTTTSSEKPCLLKRLLSDDRRNAFPANLIHYNPGLADAVQGSLVVVASPASSMSQEESHTLHVLQAANADDQQEGGQEREGELEVDEQPEVLQPLDITQEQQQPILEDASR